MIDDSTTPSEHSSAMGIVRINNSVSHTIHVDLEVLAGVEGGDVADAVGQVHGGVAGGLLVVAAEHDALLAVKVHVGIR